MLNSSGLFPAPGILHNNCPKFHPICQSSEHLLLSWLTFQFLLCHLSQLMNFWCMTCEESCTNLETKLLVFVLIISWLVFTSYIFTNIPLKKVIYICIDGLFCDNNMIHNLGCIDIRELLTFAAYEVFFIFD